jgi:hypothetical protein
MGWWHPGHRDLGRTIDSSLGSLTIMTFKKLPITAPKNPAKTSQTVLSTTDYLVK